MSAGSIRKLSEEELNDEFKHFLVSLPRKRGFSCNLYQYDGFWYIADHLQGVLNCQSRFKATDTDILLVTTPKSGTTWLKALLFTLVNRQVNTALESLTSRDPHDLVRFLEIGLYNDLNQVPAEIGLFASHMPASALPSTVWDSGCKIVYLCRDPRDLFVSLWHFGNKLRDPEDGDMSLEEAFDAFCKGINVFGPFWDHVLGYWKKSIEMPSKVLFLKYEDVKGNTPSCLRRLADFLGCPFSEAEERQGVVDKVVQLCNFERLSNLDVNTTGIQTDTGIRKKDYFRRGQVGDSLNYLTPEMTLKLDNLVKDNFHANGFNFY